jgi:tetratricopeptide (TPR) repeat protein
VAELLRVLARNFQRALFAGDLPAAEAVLLEMEDRAPLAVETRCSRLELLIRQGRDDEAERLLDSLLEQFPESARTQVVAGRFRYGRREYAAAERHFVESERLAPNPSTRRWLGRTLTQLGRFDEADAVLGRLSEQGHEVLFERAWLFERKLDCDRALELVESYLVRHPGDRFAERQKERLLAKQLPPDAIIEEMGALVELGETVPEPVLPDYVRALLTEGKREDAKQLIASLDPTPRLAGALAWACHQTFAYDLAFDLFARGLSANTSYAKYLTAFEKAGDRCGRIEDLIRIYEEIAARDPRFFGRINRLKKKLAD